MSEKKVTEDYRNEALRAIAAIEALRRMVGDDDVEAYRHATMAVRGLNRLVDDRNKAVAILTDFDVGNGADSVEQALIILGVTVLDSSLS